MGVTMDPVKLALEGNRYKLKPNLTYLFMGLNIELHKKSDITAKPDQTDRNRAVWIGLYLIGSVNGLKIIKTAYIGSVNGLDIIKSA